MSPFSLPILCQRPERERDAGGVEAVRCGGLTPCSQTHIGGGCVCLSLQDPIPLFFHPSCIYSSTGYGSRIKLTQPFPLRSVAGYYRVTYLYIITIF